MTRASEIPVFGLYGETGGFPAPVHCEAFADRAPDHDWHIAAHRHAHLAQVFLIDAGQVDIIVNGTRRALTSGDFQYVSTYSVHQLSFHPKTSGQVISFTAPVLRGLAPPTSSLGQLLAQPFHGRADATLRDLVGLLAAACRDAGPFRHERSRALAHSVLTQVASAAQQARDDPGAAAAHRLRQLDLLIAEHMAQGWGASRYAAAMALTTGHLSRLCRRATGQGAAAYIETRVMAEACQLLAFTQASVSEVGYRLGYDDPSYFTKRFQRCIGRTPSAYRSDVALGQPREQAS